MLTSTTPTIAERETLETLGVVSGEAIIGAHIFRDLMAGITNIIGGRAGGYERALREARDIAIQEMTAEAMSRGANAVVGIDLDYESVGPDGGMLMVTAAGTAVLLREAGAQGPSSAPSAGPWDSGGGFGRRRP